MGARGIGGLALVLACLLAAAPGADASPADDAAAATGTAQGASNRERQRQGGQRPDVVRVGVLINDIQQLDLQSHSYNVDMYMWFKWQDPKLDPSRSFEFLNAFELWGHILTYSTPKPERLPSGSYYQVLRNQG